MRGGRAVSAGKRKTVRLTLLEAKAGLAAERYSGPAVRRTLHGVEDGRFDDDVARGRSETSLCGPAHDPGDGQRPIVLRR